jgi:hypothetical protein
MTENRGVRLRRNRRPVANPTIVAPDTPAPSSQTWVQDGCECQISRIDGLYMLQKQAVGAAGQLLLQNERTSLAALNDRNSERTTRLRWLQINHAESTEHATVFVVPPGYTRLTSIPRAAIIPMHLGWIFKRLLELIGHTSCDICLHGGLVPEALLVNPLNHGICVGGWGLSQLKEPEAKTYSPITQIPAGYASWFPPSVHQHQPATWQVDLYLAARTAVFLGGGDPLLCTVPNLPKRLQNILQSCLLNGASAPADLMPLLLSWSRGLDVEFGRRFEPLVF